MSSSCRRADWQTGVAEGVGTGERIPNTEEEDEGKSGSTTYGSMQPLPEFGGQDARRTGLAVDNLGGNDDL